jgi:hypothetical protein
MKCPRAESTGVGKVLKQLIVNETECPVGRQWSIHHVKVRTVWHIESNLEFWRGVFVGYDCCRKYFDLRNEDFA